MTPVTDRITRAWVRTYTHGIPQAVRDDRRRELECDVWEHRACAQQAGVGRRATSFSIAARTIAGVPADLSWRRDMKGAVMTAHTTVVDGRRRIGIATDVLATLMGGFAALTGLGALLGDSDSLGWGALLLVTGLTLLAGAYLRTRQRSAGVTLIIIGAISWSCLTYWMFFTVVVGAALIVLALLATTGSRRRLA
jgi:hypothetical protein